MRNFVLLWFLVSALFLGVAVAVGVIWTGPSFVMATWSYYGSDVARLSARQAMNALETGGVAALDGFEKSIAPDGRIHLYVFADGSKEIRGRETPPAVLKLAEDLETSHGETGVSFRPVGRGFVAGCRVRDHQGHPYRFVMWLPSGVVRRIPVNIGAWLLRFSMILLTAALLCSWLAWRLSTPLLRLRQVTRQLAAGDLAVRADAPSFPRYPPEYGELARDFDHMAQRIEALVDSQRHLLQDVSHELRTPLTRLGLAVNIARGANAQEAGQALNRIDQESDRLNTLIERILRLSRLESFGDSRRCEMIEIADFMESVVSDANFEAQAQNRKVVVECLETCRVPGDRELLREAIENVIRNAIRYTREGTSVIVEGIQTSEKEYRILVRDHGPGVPAEHLGSIFRPFHRAPQAPENANGGFGLGLAIAKRAIDLHRGSIAGRNGTEGFEITIGLPLEN